MRNLMIRPTRFGFPTRLDPFFDDFFRRPFWDENDGTYAPTVDITESKSEYTLTFELPGIDKNGIKVGIEDGRSAQDFGRLQGWSPVGETGEVRGSQAHTD